MSPRHALGALSAAVLVLALAACGDDTPDGSASGDGPPAAGGAGGGDCTTEPAETDGLTDGGQVVCLGTPVTMRVRDVMTETTAVAEMTITGWERADDALIDEFITSGYPDITSSSHDLWFVRGTGELVDATGESDSWRIGYVAGLRGDDGALGVATLAHLPDCSENSLDGAQGETTDLCLFESMPAGAAPTLYSYVDNVEDGRGESLLSSSIVWR